MGTDLLNWYDFSLFFFKNGRKLLWKQCVSSQWGSLHVLIMPAGMVVFSEYTAYTMKWHRGDLNNYRCLKNEYPSHALRKIEEVSKRCQNIESLQGKNGFKHIDKIDLIYGYDLTFFKTFSQIRITPLTSIPENRVNLSRFPFSDHSAMRGDILVSFRCASEADSTGYEMIATLSRGFTVMPSKLLERTNVGFWLILSIPSSLDIACIKNIFKVWMKYQHFRIL